MKQRCPICEGTGNVPGGFYQSTWAHNGQTTVSNNSIEVCKACKGTGIVNDND